MPNSHRQVAPQNNAAQTRLFEVALHNFAGFYESVHDLQINSAIESIFSDDQGNDQTPENFHMAFSMTKELKEAYCKEYVDQLRDYFKEEMDFDVPSLTFQSVTSPREYNFETDRIVATIDQADMEALIARFDANRHKVQAEATEMLEPRSGFIPFYPSDLTEWDASLLKWDANQLGIALQGSIGRWNDGLMLDSKDCFHEAVENSLWTHMPPKARMIANAFNRVPVADDDGPSF